MNTATQKEIVPGMSVQVIDWAEPPNEWVWFIVTSVKADRVFLCTRKATQTWAYRDEIFLRSL